MKKQWLMAMGLGLALAGSRLAVADVWDIQTNNDNSSATLNELVHGSDQIHDLGVQAGSADQDWYQISQKAYSSYEVVVDGTSGDVGTVGLDRMASDGSVAQSAVAAGVGFTRSLRWINATAAAVDTEHVRVQSGGCTTDCGTDDVYRIRSYETTAAIPRFNNAGTQVTVVILQNPTTDVITGNVYFWNTAGTLIATRPFSLTAKNTLVFNSAPLTLATAGAVTIVHDGRYGDLSGKTVALEPSTGFSFDSPMLSRPH